jgi:hypothetical protein
LLVFNRHARDEREHDDREWSFRIAMLPDSLYRTPMRQAREDDDLGRPKRH